MGINYFFYKVVTFSECICGSMGRKFESQLGHIHVTFLEMHHEILSAVILPLSLIDTSCNTFYSHSPPSADWYIMQYFLQSFSPFRWLIHHAILSTVILPLSLVDTSCNTCYSHSPPFTDWYIMQYFLQSFSPFHWLIHHAILSTVILSLLLIDTSWNTFYSHSPPFADRYIMQYFLQSFSPFLWFKTGSYQLLAKVYAPSTGWLLRGLKRKSVSRLTDRLGMALTVFTGL